MAVGVHHFTFVCNTVTGTQTIVSGLSFTPKAYILWMVGATADATFSADVVHCVGMCDGTNQYVQGGGMDDGSTTSDTGRAYYNNAVLLTTSNNVPTTVNGLANHSSFGSDSIVIDWTDAAPLAYIVHGIAFGGSDLTVEVQSTTCGRSTTGTQSYSLSTVTTPVAGIFLTPASTNALGSSQAHYSLSIGAAVSSSNYWTICLASENGLADTDCWRYANTDACLMAIEEDSGAVRFKATLSSWGSSQFTLNYTDATNLSSTDNFAFMVFQGGNWDAGSFRQNATTGDQVITTATNVDTIRGLIFASDKTALSSTVQANNRVCLGAASTTSAQGCIWYGDRDANATQQTASISENADVILLATESSSHGSSTINAQASLTSIGIETFTLNYSVSDGGANDICWLAVGETITVAESTLIADKAFGNPLNAFSGDYQKPIFGY